MYDSSQHRFYVSLLRINFAIIAMNKVDVQMNNYITQI